jgi:hypothetical protein
VVAIAASIAGDTSQDLKTGYLLGATPRLQQTGELVGVLTSATFVCLSVLLLAETFGFGSDRTAGAAGDPDEAGHRRRAGAEPALGPGGDRRRPRGRRRTGPHPSLPFAVGVYLPVSTMTPIFLGGMLQAVARAARAAAGARRSRGATGASCSAPASSAARVCWASPSPAQLSYSVGARSASARAGWAATALRAD